MGLFRPYERRESDEDSPAKTGSSSASVKAVNPTKVKRREAPKAEATSESSSATQPTPTKRQPQKKSAPTPTRKEAEAERMQRLHPTLNRKQQRAADREARAKARQDGWDKVEASPARVLARDFIDSRWTLAEFMLPGMIIIMAGAMLTAGIPQVSQLILLSLWGLLIFGFLNIYVIYRSFKKVLAEREPNASTRGLFMYMLNRAMMIRRFRRPAPRIKRGDPV